MEVVAAAQQEESLKAAIAEKEADMAAAAAEKELQAGGEVRELQAAADEQSKQCACRFLGRSTPGFMAGSIWGYRQMYPKVQHGHWRFMQSPLRCNDLPLPH